MKERYAPERSSLARMADLRTSDGEEEEEDEGTTSSWLLCRSSEDFLLFFCSWGKKKMAAHGQLNAGFSLAQEQEAGSH